MRPLFVYYFKKSRFLVMWSNDLHSQSIEKSKYGTGSKSLDILCNIFLFIYTRVEGFGLYMGWLIREPYYVDKAIKNSEERLERFIKMKVPQIIIDNEREILTKRRWAKEMGYETMEEFNASRE